MTLFKNKIVSIKNSHKKRLETDFYYNHYSWMILVLSTILPGVIVNSLGASPSELLVLVALPIFGLIMGMFPFWTLILAEILFYWGICGWLSPNFSGILGISGTLGILLSTSIHVVYQWDKAVILRLGKFHRVKNPGIFFIIPLLDRVADFVDTRIRVTDFTSEKTISKDTVPLQIDALCFWMVWEPRKAILEVENYLEAVTLGAQTALRDAVGRHELSEILSRKETMVAEIKQSLAQKIDDWGITIISIEFTDITIPKDLEDAMSRKAQAEREKCSRIILAQAEAETANIYAQAAKELSETPGALQLRGMNMVYDGLKNPQNSMMVVPSSLMETLDMGTLLGYKAYHQLEEKERKEKSAKENNND